MDLLRRSSMPKLEPDDQSERILNEAKNLARGLNLYVWRKDGQQPIQKQCDREDSWHLDRERLSVRPNYGSFVGICGLPAPLGRRTP